MAETIKRNTIQKQTIAKIVLASCDHPTAETIYNRVRAEIPTISLGTVYRVLKELVAEGIIREIMVPSAPSRFDKTTRLHAHFVCRVCQEVTDLQIDEARVLTEAIDKNNNNIDEAEIIFRGICEKCCK